MILDSGICSVFTEVDKSAPGQMPNPVPELRSQSWYGELDFATAEEWPTEDREQVAIDARIRILQDRSITNHDTVVLHETHDIPEDAVRYEVTRAFHGRDDESGELITDLTLKRVSL